MKMEIKTKFNVGSLVEHKFNRPDHDSVRILEVAEVITQTCYAGTQVFYECRALIGQKVKKRYENDFVPYWEIAHGLCNHTGQMGWHKYREDELVCASDNAISIITTGK